MASVLVILAAGFEEIEAVTVIDVLRRAGVDVTVAGLNELTVTGSHGISVSADILLDDTDAEAVDMVVLPGGMPGTDNLQADPRVTRILTNAAARDAWTAAICAAPRVLGAAGLLDGRQATSFPGFLEGLANTEVLAVPVVTDGKVVTSRGAGTAMSFALELVARLTDEQAAAELAAGMQCEPAELRA